MSTLNYIDENGNINKAGVIPNGYPASNIKLSDGRSVQDLTNSGFGTAVNVKTYTSSDYVAPSDGYLSVLAEIPSGGFAELQINGVPYRIIATSDYSGKDMLFIRKGMKIRFSNVIPSTALSSVTANFYPLV